MRCFSVFPRLEALQGGDPGSHLAPPPNLKAPREQWLSLPKMPISLPGISQAFNKCWLD